LVVLFCFIFFILRDTISKFTENLRVRWPWPRSRPVIPATLSSVFARGVLVRRRVYLDFLFLLVTELSYLGLGRRSFLPTNNTLSAHSLRRSPTASWSAGRRTIGGVVVRGRELLKYFPPGPMFHNTFRDKNDLFIFVHAWFLCFVLCFLPPPTLPRAYRAHRCSEKFQILDKTRADVFRKNEHRNKTLFSDAIPVVIVERRDDTHRPIEIPMTTLTLDPELIWPVHRGSAHA